MGIRVLYKNARAEKQFSSKYMHTWRYPEKVKEKLLSVENFLLNASSLQDVAAYPPFRFHRLAGDRKGEWSISLGNTGYRVTFIPCDDQERELLDGDILSQCKLIKIVLVTEVSNHYE